MEVSLVHHRHAPHGAGFTGLLTQLSTLMAVLFSTIFVIYAMYLCGISVYQLFGATGSKTDLVESLVKSVNFAIVGLAVFELAVSIQQEYVGRDHKGNVIQQLRRSVARFISVVCIALSLESLMMAIKYSQLDLAGNLYYPVAIIIGAAVLLLALGVFLHLTRNEASDEASGLHRSANHAPVAADSHA